VPIEQQNLITQLLKCLVNAQIVKACETCFASVIVAHLVVNTHLCMDFYYTAPCRDVLLCCCCCWSRYCLGVHLAMAEMKTVLAVLARCYAFTADNNTEWRQAVGKVPVNGLPMVLTPL